MRTLFLCLPDSSRDVYLLALCGMLSRQRVFVCCLRAFVAGVYGLRLGSVGRGVRGGHGGRHPAEAVPAPDEGRAGSFLGREGPQKSTPYPGFKLEFKNTPQIQKINLKCKSGDFELKLKFH